METYLVKFWCSAPDGFLQQRTVEVDLYDDEFKSSHQEAENQISAKYKDDSQFSIVSVTYC